MHTVYVNSRPDLSVRLLSVINQQFIDCPQITRYKYCQTNHNTVFVTANDGACYSALLGKDAVTAKRGMRSESYTTAQQIFKNKKSFKCRYCVFAS